MNACAGNLIFTGALSYAFVHPTVNFLRQVKLYRPLWIGLCASCLVWVLGAMADSELRLRHELQSSEQSRQELQDRLHTGSTTESHCLELVEMQNSVFLFW